MKKTDKTTDQINRIADIEKFEEMNLDEHVDLLMDHVSAFVSETCEASATDQGTGYPIVAHIAAHAVEISRRINRDK